MWYGTPAKVNVDKLDEYHYYVYTESILNIANSNKISIRHLNLIYQFLKDTNFDFDSIKYFAIGRTIFVTTLFLKCLNE